MNLFPQGFLSTIFCLRALPPALFAELANPGDEHSAQGGELLILPQGGLGEEAGFIGLESMGTTAIARVCEGSGPAVLEEARQSAFVAEVGDPAAQAVVMQQVLNLSSQLQRSGQGGLVRVTVMGGEAVLHPYEELAPLPPTQDATTSG